MLEQFRTRIEAWRLYRRTVDKLHDLDDRTLIDMGVPRASIRRVAHQIVFGAGDPRS